MLPSKEDKLADSFEFGVTVNDIMETGKLALAHTRHDQNKYQKKSSNYLAGEYGIGGMILHIGVAQDKSEDNTACQTYKVTNVAVAGKPVNKVKANGEADGHTIATTTTTTYSHTTASNCVGSKTTDTTTFAGIRGSVGDTGISYLFQARSKKTKGTASNLDTSTDATTGTGDDVADAPDTLTNQLVTSIDGLGKATSSEKTTPWIFGLTKTLGGASVHFEFADDDEKGSKSKSALWLKVDF